MIQKSTEIRITVGNTEIFRGKATQNTAMKFKIQIMAGKEKRKKIFLSRKGGK